MVVYMKNEFKYKKYYFDLRDLEIIVFYGGGIFCKILLNELWIVVYLLINLGG